MLRATTWLTIVRAIQIAASMGVTVLLVRVLEPAIEGQYFVFTSLTTLAAAVGSVGLGPVMVHEAHQAADGLQGTFRVGLRVVVVATSLTGLAAAVLFAITAGGHHLWVFVVPAVVLTLGKAVSIIASETRRGIGDAAIAAVSGGPTIVFASTLGALAVAILVAPHGLLALTLGAGTSTLAFGAGMLGLLSARLRARGRPRRLSKETSALAVVRRGRAYLVANVLASAANNLDIWLLALITDFENAGAFGIAVRIAVVFALPMTAANTLLPKYLPKGSLEDSVGARSIVAAARSATAVTLGFAGLWVLLGRSALRLGLNEPRFSVYVIVIVLACGHLVSAVLGASGLVLTLRGDSASLQFGAVVNLTTTAFLGVPMAFLFGPVGLAIASALGSAAQNYGLYRRCLMKHRIATSIWSGRLR